MSYLAVAGLLIAAVSFICCLLVVTSRPLHSIKVTWGGFSFAVGLWGLGLFKAYSSHEYGDALFWLRLLNLSAISIPVFFLHFAVLFTKSNKRYRHILRICYGIAVFFIAIAVLFPDSFIPSIGPKLHFKYYPDPGMLYYIFFIFFAYIALRGVIVLLHDYRRASLLRRGQLKYFLVGLAVGFLGGTTTFLPVFGFNIQPYGVFLVPLYVAAVTAISIRHQLIDLELFVVRTTILILVYACVLGLPFVLAYYGKQQLVVMFKDNWWVVPLLCSTATATTGPFLYLYLQQKAEERLLKEQRRYQATLIQASSGMGRIRELKKLLRLIVKVVTRVVRVEHSAVYVFKKEKGAYVLGSALAAVQMEGLPQEIPASALLVEQLLKYEGPILTEEIRQRAEYEHSLRLHDLLKELSSLHGVLVVPSMMEDRLVGFLVLGAKVSKKTFGPDDLSVFTILANQSALAIENAQSYEEMKRTQEQLFKADKMATIGTMADGLSHQINNRLHALGFIASDMLDTLRLRKPLFVTPELKVVADEFEYSLSRMQDNVHHGGEIVRGLMKYTRKGEEGFAGCDLDDIIRTAYEMAQFKIRSAEFKIIKEYNPQAVPKVRGNFTQLQEVFFNLIDNAYDATVQRKTELKEEGYEGVIRVSVKEDDGLLEITFRDNGIGVKSTDKDKLFTPFFTTKATSKKGTGLGLYVIRKIIEDNHGGKVEMRSVYGQGTDMVLRLSVNEE
jgi:signal transduction histidine kinase